MMNDKKITVVQVLPSLDSGGVERGTLEVGKYLCEKGHKSIVISKKGRLVNQLENEGSQHINWNIGQKSLFTLFLVPGLIRLLREERVDVIHARSRFPAWICFIALSFISRNKRPLFVTTFHGPYSINFYSGIMARGDKVIAISEFIKQYIVKNYKINPNKIILNYRGVEGKHFPYGFRPERGWINEWHKKFPRTRNKILITLPARVTRWKGHEDFIRIISMLVKKNSQIHGLIVGEVKNGKNTYQSDLVSKVRELGLNDTITFVGHRSDLKEIMSISKIVMSLSMVPEAFGRVSLEALSLGVPVIAYDHGGVSEQLHEIFPEGLVSVGRIENVSALCLKFINNPPVIKRDHKFKLTTMLKNTLRVYTDKI
jgi:glycosyltransferase involved in cell wall biosynthesis|tara:strand:- start:2619 stop:3731 length:1113 start_codon:yes stop_codon:yes gene_type:complete